MAGCLGSAILRLWRCILMDIVRSSIYEGSNEHAAWGN